jgi:hypothetical protein
MSQRRAGDDTDVGIRCQGDFQQTSLSTSRRNLQPVSQSSIVYKKCGDLSGDLSNVGTIGSVQPYLVVT